MESERSASGTLTRPTDLTALTIDVDGRTHVVRAGDGPVTVGRHFPAQILIDDAHVSRTHLRIEANHDGWTGTDESRNGVFLDGAPLGRFAVTDDLSVRLGHPDGVAVAFGFIHDRGDPAFDDDEDPAGSDDDVDPILLRVGEAIAARRRELDLAQRTLARDKVINAGTLIDVEKGRRWPRDGTRARLERALGWTPGTIERLRAGGTPGLEVDGERDETMGGSTTVEATFVFQAVELALASLSHTIGELPAPTAPEFTARVGAVLGDLRRLEVVATNAARSARGAQQVVLILSGVRQTYRDVMLRAARSPRATLGQVLYAARQRAELTVEEAAGAAGVRPEVIVAAESDDALPAAQRRAIERLLNALSG